MRYFILALALLISQSIYAADSVKVKKVEKVKKEQITDTVKVKKVEKVKDADTIKVKRSKKAKEADTVKVVPPPPPAHLFTDIIPQPLSLVKGEGRFTIDERTIILCDKKFSKAADYLRLYIPIERTKGKKSNAIRLVLNEELGKEEYTLIINKKGIEIQGADYGGIFNGIQSLLQLLPHEIYSKSAQLPMEVSYIEVKDAPKNHYRGYLLDVARTYQPVHEIKRVLDYMAFCKMNKLHLHLVDNPAWRIEIKKYPKLTEVGAWRESKGLGYGNVNPDSEQYGGFYTQKDIKDIEFGCTQPISYVAASFTRRAQDIIDIKKLLVENGRSDIQIIAKIEKNLLLDFPISRKISFKKADFI